MKKKAATKDEVKPKTGETALAMLEDALSILNKLPAKQRTEKLIQAETVLEKAVIRMLREELKEK